MIIQSKYTSWLGPFMGRFMRRMPSVWLLLLAALAPFSVFALSPEALRLVGQTVQGGPMTLSEVNAMPPPCHAIGMGTIGGVFWAEGMNKNGTTSILGRPENAMASGAIWYHHYCWGLLGKHRAFASVRASNRAFLIKTWRNEMQYIVDWTNTHKIKWPYLNLVHKEIAESYIQEKDYANATRSANTAVEVNPDSPLGYILLADIHEQLKDREKALAEVTKGLKQVPNSKGLQRRYKDLGGRMPFPEPNAKPEQAPPEIAKQEAPIADPPDSSAAATETIPAELPRVQPPGNPHCRFCP